MDATQFIAKWGPSGGSERSNYQLFLTELCDLLGVEHPDAAGEDNRHNAHVFERAITERPQKRLASAFGQLPMRCDVRLCFVRDEAGNSYCGLIESIIQAGGREDLGVTRDMTKSKDYNPDPTQSSDPG